MATDRPRFPLARALLLAGVLGCMAAPAWAQPAAPSAADKETARAMHQSGDKKLGAANYQGALADYKAADLIMGVPSTRLAVARAQEKLGMLVESLDSALSIPRIPKRNPEPEVFLRARASAIELGQSLRPRIPSVRFTIQGVPEGRSVTVSIDGSNVPSALLSVPRKVNPGKHAIAAQLDGFKPFRQEVMVAEGQAADVPIKLEPAGDGAAAAPVPAPATSGTDPVATPPPAGTEASPAEPDEVESSGGISPLVWIGFGVGAAGFIVGGITGGIAAGKKSDLEERCPDNACPRADTEEDLDSAYTMAHVSTAGFIVGGVGVALGVVGLLLPSGSEESSTGSIVVRPVVGLGSAGITGSF